MGWVHRVRARDEFCSFSLVFFPLCALLLGMGAERVLKENVHLARPSTLLL